MKVIKKADCSDWKYHTSCGTCGSELEVEPADVHHKYYLGDQREGSWDDYWAYCAVCKTKLSIPNDVVSKALKHYVATSGHSNSSS